ncbi:MAG TPA: hypothetical protein VGC13_13155 [Longimicrobium sp.]|jgi:hypothetical protein|uniref:hypothetical protein n=1 Tax=Longimicrobium sp. TaxID=2029185 RepID=UPI002ED9CC9A
MLIDEADAESLIAACPPERLVVWAGAGISYSYPTGLPLGFALTDFALDETCGVAFRARLVNLWERANEICSPGYRPEPFSQRPRLESVLGGFGELERDAADPSVAFLPAFTSFADAPPNAVHFTLASLVLKGAAVFTANFDLCLQAAVRHLVGRPDPFDLEVAGSIRRFILKPELGAGEIVHFHGVADDPEYLGATLARIKEGLPQPFEPLERRLDRGALLLMVGYSASDAFDVNPYFQQQPAGRWSKSALLFVRHEGGSAPTHLPLLGTGFGKMGAVSAHTGLLLSAAAGGVHPVDEEPAFDWKAEFRARLAGAGVAGQRALRILSVAHALGINVDGLDAEAYQEAEAHNPGFDTERHRYLLAMTGRERGSLRKELEHTPRASRSGGHTLGSAYAGGDLLAASGKAMQLDEIWNAAQVAGPLDWHPYTSLSTHGRILLSPYLKRPWRSPMTPGTYAAVERVLGLADLLARRPLRDVNFIRQIATALRMKLLLESLLHDGQSTEREGEILSLYAECADLAGFVSSYRDFAFTRLLRVRYAPWRARPRLVWQAGRFAWRSFRLARTLRDRRGARCAMQLGMLVAAYGMYVVVALSLPVPSPPPGSRA